MRAQMAPSARPTRLGRLVFETKASVLRLNRARRDLVSGPRRLSGADAAAFPVVLAESRTPLWSDLRPEEQAHQRGKVHNLRRAARQLNGVRVPAGAVLSFWKQVRRASRRRGYVDGRMLQQGCLVPAIGGGLCQLSNALYQVALEGGAQIVERHAHSRIVPGSAAAWGRDATVAWNYVDLRFRARQEMLIEVQLDQHSLSVRLRGRTDAHVPAVEPSQAVETRPVAASCASCGDTACHRQERPSDPRTGATAYLVDEGWPEFVDYVHRVHRSGDRLGLPIDGARWGLSRHRWTSREFAMVRTATGASLMRAIAARRLQADGPARLAAQFAAAGRIASRLSGVLDPDVTHVCVAQSLLPFLWREGHLGGRSFSVLMNRLPMLTLEARLDAAWRSDPSRVSLVDFRAPEALARAEAEALAAADCIVTPHAEIAAMFPGRAEQLDWQMPAAAARYERPGRSIAFPGPTIARAGAYELREAAQVLDLEVLPLGRTLEQLGFWHGIRARLPQAPSGSDWLRSVAAVVQPALVEAQPRRLLAALAAGVPVIATAACGIAPRSGLVIVPPHDPAALIAALEQVPAIAGR
jgi:hypothetical protein